MTRHGLLRQEGPKEAWSTWKVCRTGEDGAVRRVGSLDLLVSARIQQFSYASEWLEHGFALGRAQPGATA